MPHRRAMNKSCRYFARRGVVLWCALATFSATSGCVHRRLTVRTNPPGAEVYIDNYAIGTSPVSTSFLYYGTRKFRIVKDGYETLTVEQKIPAPWYQYFPLDFVAENVWPGDIRDEQTLDFQLAPQHIVPTELILERAENLRAASHPTVIAPPGTGAIFAPQAAETIPTAPLIVPGTPPAMAPSNPQILPAPTTTLPQGTPLGPYPTVPPPPPFSGTPRAPALQMTPGLPPGYVPAPTSALPPTFQSPPPTQPLYAPPPVMAPQTIQ